MIRAVLWVGCFATAVAAAGLSASADEQTMLDKGRQVYERWCAICHSPGAKMPGTFALAYKYRMTRVPPVLAERVDLTPAAIKSAVRQGASVMPFFRKTEISDVELVALTDYLTRRR